MRVERISDQEANFERIPRDADGKTHTLIRKAIEVPGEDREMRYVDCKPADDPESYYYRTRHPKEQIVLHFTMGYLRGDIATLTRRDYHVSVPLLIARSGTIYNLFPSYYWSYHLGRGALGGNGARSMASVAIELSNIGPLRREGNVMLTAYSQTGRRDIYCDAGQDDAYEEATFRGFGAFASFTEAQYDSLITVLRYLTARYNIPRRFLPKSKRFNTTLEAAQFRGIVSHVNFRPRGKADIGPAFDWDRLVEGVGV